MSSLVLLGKSSGGIEHLLSFLPEQIVDGTCVSLHEVWDGVTVPVGPGLEFRLDRWNSVEISHVQGTTDRFGVKLITDNVENFYRLRDWARKVLGVKLVNGFEEPAVETNTVVIHDERPDWSENA